MNFIDYSEGRFTLVLSRFRDNFTPPIRLNYLFIPGLYSYLPKERYLPQGDVCAEIRKPTNLR